MHGWKTVSLGDVCVIEKTKYKDGELPYVGMEDIVSGTGKFVGCREPKKVGSSTFQFTPEHLLYGRLRPYLNKVLLPDFEGHCSSEIFPLLPKSELDKSFLFYWITSEQVVKEINCTCTGARMPRANVNEVLKFDIPIPPIDEQKRIVAILDEAFAGIDTAIANTEKNLANARELFDSTSQSIFLGGTDWVKKTLLELLELNWITSHLDGNHGGDYPRKSEFVEHGIPYISAKCIKDDSVDISLSKFLTPERASKLRKGIAQDRDVLFAHNATVGPVAMLYTDLEKIILGTSLTYYRCNTDHIIPEYLAHYMRSPVFKNQYEMVMRQSTRNQVPITKQREFFHLIPPLDEQKEIADRLDGIRIEALRLEAVYKQKLASLSELKQSLLQKAFSGELTAEGDKLMDEAVA